MIARIWHGRVPREKAGAYAEFLVRRAVPDYGSAAGLRKLLFLRRNEGEVSHFLLLTLWESMEAMREFAGDRPEMAVYYPEDDEFLLEKEERVELYEVFYEG